MAIRAIIDKLDDAPEAIREHYAEQDGKFVLSVEPVNGYSLEDVSGLKSALGKERTTRETLERQVVAFKDLDPDKAREALAKLEELGNLDPAKEADKIANTKFEAAKAQLLEKHAQEISQRDERNAKLSGAMDKLVRQAAATSAIAEAKGSVELLLPHVLAATRVKETEDGDFIVEVVDAKGNVRIGDAKGSPMDLKGLIAEMRGSDTYARAFDGDGQSGSGKTADQGGGSGMAKGDMGGDRAARQAAIAAKYKLPAA
jgi:hypothetical protein